MIVKAQRLLLVLALALAAATPAAAQKHYSQLSFPPLRDLQLPHVERVVLPNGLVLYLVEDHTLPKVEGAVLIKAGARFEPADKIGLASILGQVIRTGGSTSRPGEEIDRLLANVGAVVETSIDTTSANASLFALKEDLPLALEILADLLQHPALPQDKIDLAKTQERTAVSRRNDDVGSIADREFEKLVYGADSPYARHTEYETIQTVTRDDLVAFHRRYFQPNQAIIGLWGDFNPAQTRALVEKHFGAWPRQEVELPPLPAVPADWQGSIGFIQKDDVNQTNLRIGHPGGRYDDPDYYSLIVMAEVLGGGLSSRLFRRIRSDLGLAYASFAAWQAAFDHPGRFYIRVDTKSESTVQALRETLQEVRRLTTEPVSQEELRVAKEGILNSFVFNFDTTGEIVRRLMAYEYYNYPRDFLERYKAGIEKVTADDVLRAAARHVQPDKLVILAAGRQQDFDQPLSVVGAVRAVDISIPPPPTAAAPEATPAALEQGREVLRAALQGLGGLERLESLHTIATLAEVAQVTPQGELTLNTKVVLALPDRFRIDMVTPFGTMAMVYEQQGGWVKTPQGVQDLPPPQKENFRKSLARHPVNLLLGALKENRPVQYLESTQVEGKEADVILVPDALGDTVKLYIEKGTGHILKRSGQGMAPQGAVQEDVLFSDFREVSGLTVPFKEVTYQDGQRVSERKVSNVEVNPALDPALFTREEAQKPQ